MAHQFYFNPYILDNLPAPAKGFDVVQDISDPMDCSMPGLPVHHQLP